MADLTSYETAQAASQPAGTVEVVVRHQGVEHKVIGTPEGVVRELLSYLSKIFPSLEIASKVLLSVDTSEFLQSCAGIIANAPEGTVVLKNIDSLADKDLLLLHLSGAKMANILGKRETDTMSLEETTRATARSTGTVAGRLSELRREQLIDRVGKGSYRLTTMGVRTVVRSLMPKLATLPDR